MVTILPRQQSLGEILGTALGGSITGGLQGYQQGLAQRLQAEQKEEERKNRLLKQQQFAELLYGKPLSGPLSELSGPASGGESLTQRAPLSRDQSLQAAALAGLSPQEMMQLEKTLIARDQEDLARKSLEAKQEAPQRAKELEDVFRISNQVPVLKKELNDYKALVKIADNPNLVAGNKARLLDRLGIREFFNNPTTEAADKLVNDVSIARLTGMKGVTTDRKLEAIAKSNPSLLNSPQAMKNLALLHQYRVESEMAVGEELNKLRKEYKGKVLPLGIVEEAEERAQKKIDEIEEKREKLVDEIANAASQSMTSQKSFESIPPAWQFKGRTIMNPQTGKRLMSDGFRWKEL